MRLLILLLVLGVGIVFFVQNQQAVTLVFFGNLARMTLPIAGWVLIFIAAGALTSLLWRLLSSLGKPSVPRNFEANRSRSYSPPPPPPFPQNPQTPQMTSDYRPPQDYSRSPAQTPASSYRSDWDSKDYQEEWDDWDVQKPAREPAREPVRDFVREVPREPAREPVRDFVREVPREPTQTEERTVEDSDRKLEEDKSTVFETEQQPKSSTRTGSVYSYVYREPKDRQDKEQDKEESKQDKEEDNSDRVYDANYRVILPPYQNTQEQRTRENEDEEDWI
jgi:hypothetical protein